VLSSRRPLPQREAGIRTRRYLSHGLATVAGLHGAWFVTGGAALLIVALGAAAAVILVALAPREHRAEAIRAAAEMLAALLPWPGRRDRRGPLQMSFTGQQVGVHLSVTLTSVARRPGQIASGAWTQTTPRGGASQACLSGRVPGD